MARTSPRAQRNPVASRNPLEQCGELKIGQVGIANLRVRELDVATLVAEMRERVARAPKLFQRAAVVLDFGGLSRCPDAASAHALIAGLRDAGALPVALAYGTSEIEALAQELGLPLLAKFRAQYEGQAPAEPATAPAVVKAAPAAPVPANGVGQIHAQPVRSGQQVYAQGRDLIITAAVGAGAEVIADGSIHIYAPLRGRALAGAQGDRGARIFCREFDAELVAIAGHYKVLEEIPAELRERPVQIWLDDERIQIEAMA